MKKKKFRFQWGAFLLLVVYGGLFFILFARIVTILVTGEVEGQALTTRAAALYQKENSIPASRGRILDSNGNTIAEDTLSYRLVAVISPSATTNEKKPRHVVDAQKTAEILSQYIPMEEEEIYERLISKDKYQVEFGSAGRGVNYNLMSQIQEHNLPGITFVRDLKRYYPNGIFASHLIGFALKEDQKDGSVLTKGKMGLESIYDDELSGENGKVEFKSDKFGYLLAGSDKMITPAKDGYDIYLTLDKSIQNFLEDAMNRVAKKYTPESMIAVVANPKTGEILAMSQRPTFDPDTRSTPNMNWLNEVVEETIEPGSTLKTFTLASAIDSGKWTPNEYYQSGKYIIYDREIRDHNEGEGWGPITYLEGFQRSSNTAMANLLKKIGNENFLEYLDKFGFGKKTGIDLPSEASGTILSKNPVEVVTTTFGQGSTVTPIQLVQAITAIANDGKMMKPYVIDKIVDPNTDKVVEDHQPIVAGKPISADTAKQVREILASTLTSKVGTASDFILDEYEVAGKTGTAQIPKPNGGYYWGPDQFLYSFLGMAPVEDPQLVMYIAVEKPKLKGALGSEPVSEIFDEVMSKSLKYLNINPENIEQTKVIKLPNYEKGNAENVQVQLSNDGLIPIIIGDGGTIVDQYPKEGQQVTEGQLIFLKTEGAVTIPEFTNWSLRNVLIYKSLSGLPIEVFGEGYVDSQSVSSGVVVTDNAPIVVKLKKPEELFQQTNQEVDAEGESLPQD